VRSKKRYPMLETELKEVSMRLKKSLPNLLLLTSGMVGGARNLKAGAAVERLVLRAASLSGLTLDEATLFVTFLVQGGALRLETAGRTKPLASMFARTKWVFE